MIAEKERVLLEHLRQNSRKSLAKISSETKIPLSTLFEALKRLESNVILKHVSLLDFSKLGYGVRVNFLINAMEKNQLKDFLIGSANVNNLSSMTNGCDFMLECIFKDLKELSEFRERLEKFRIRDVMEIFVIDEIKKEEFCI